MSTRADRRRRRESVLAEAAEPAPAAAAPESRTRRKLPKRRGRLPLLPFLGAAAGLALLGAAYTTTLPPGPGSGGSGLNRFTVQIPAERLAVINSWERFFICYDLTEGVQLPGGIVDLTLRAHQRTSGTLDFPGERVEVVLPVTGERDGGAEERPAAGPGEEEIINLRQRIAQAASDGAVRRQCGGAG